MAADGTTRTYTVNVGVVQGNGVKVIASFEDLGVFGTITNAINNSTVMLTLPAGTDLSAQSPTRDQWLKPQPGSRVPQNFTQPVMYITASDGSTRLYTP